MTDSPIVPKVSVVVPAYNPGPHVEKLITSLLCQSLPPAEFEAVFVDDGSTDSTPARLDELAAAHPHIRVLHIDNSGWPSRPRNVGVAAARGEYVFFADDDDWFGDEALERLYARAAAHDADIVVGKMAGHGRSVPRELFRRDRADATLANSPLIDSLTAHKLFRRSFLDEHELRFPEGPRRLEDHAMVTRALLLSRRTCVLADYVCYHHLRRGDAGNLTARKLDPAGYYANLREVLDIVDAHTEPGPLRDRLHRRWLRNEMISRLRGNRLLQAPEDWVAQVALECGKVIRERFAPGVAAGLPPLNRAIASLTAQDRLAELRGLAEWEAGVRVRARVGEHLLTGSVLTLTVTAHLESGDQPVTLAVRDGRHRLVLPVDGVDPDLLDVTDSRSKTRLDVIVRRKDGGEEFFLPVDQHVEEKPVAAAGPGRVHFVHRATARLDVATLNSGRTEGTWILKARLTENGWTEDARLTLSFWCAADGAAPTLVLPRAGARTRLRRALKRLLGR
ncbi:glycosyltransferase family 2 protein [Micromonospora sp. RTGN7]|uniref:glycosyltransferase family 2 protein n=1 Tax=Micromonospora sp. RTGN7 TaxID=3016526 RepID=UPI0029FF1298|nr:glycosyltransferase family 2 protein [Micromonospora sp. RTGN7]